MHGVEILHGEVERLRRRMRRGPDVDDLQRHRPALEIDARARLRAAFHAEERLVEPRRLPEIADLQVEPEELRDVVRPGCGLRFRCRLRLLLRCHALLLGSVRIFGEPRQPLLGQRKTFAVDAIEASAPLPLVVDHAGLFQHAQVSGRRRPGLLEHRRDLSGRHRAALEVERREDPPPRWMGKSDEESFIGVVRVWPAALRHRGYT